MDKQQNKENTNKNSKPQKDHNRHYFLLFFRLQSRFTIVLFLQLLVFLGLYGAGNFSKFMDSTQAFILNACLIISMLLALLSATGLITTIVRFFVSKKGRYWIYFVLYILLLTLSIIVFAFTRTVTFVSAGI